MSDNNEHILSSGVVDFKHNSNTLLKKITRLHDSHSLRSFAVIGITVAGEVYIGASVAMSDNQAISESLTRLLLKI